MDKDYGDHIREIKRRVIWCFFCFLTVLCFCVVKADTLFRISMKFAREAGFEIISVSPGDSVVAEISLIIKIALFLTMPFIACQCVEFILPALTGRNVFRVRMASLLMIILFYLGVVFSLFVMLPFFFGFMSEYGERFSITGLFSVSDYMGFVCMFSACMGLAFETPVFVGVLWSSGLVDRNRIKRFRSVFYLLIFVGAAIITPPDVVSQIMVAVPMLALFELGNVCGMRISRKRTGGEK